MEKTKAKKKPKRGRPLIKIDWAKVEKLCSIHCTGEEIAAILEIDYDTLGRAIKRKYKKDFADYFKKHSSTGRASLRRMQFKAAEGGNPTMLIWLGKQYLDQKDKQALEHTGADGGPIKTIDSSLDPLEAQKLYAAMIKGDGNE